LLAETLQQGRGSAETSAEALATIVGETEHLSTLVDNVLGTARIENGTRSYRIGLVSVPDVVRSACRRFEYALAKEGFRLLESIPSTPLWARADPDALAQAVLNLLGNALKYSGPSREIRLAVTTEGTGILISVGDDGVGIAAEEEASIFESFYRSGRTAGETGGSGLGLALVKHFAQAHGGSVSVTSERGKGSVFTITLPGADGPGADGVRQWQTS
jgi:signal transduction histidine kinase